jgi:MAP/microtubule affinity-regulating kinase
MLIDDPWINESYGDSPITTDMGEVMLEDENILRVVEAKFKLDRDTILKALRDGSYNDISAIYYLLYYERDNKDSKISLDSQDIVQMSSRTKGSSNAMKDPTMVKIEEDSIIKDEELQQVAKPAAVVQARRRRAQTVGGDNLKDTPPEQDNDEEKAKEPEAFPTSNKDDPSKVVSRQTAVNPFGETQTSQSVGGGNQAANRQRTNTIVGIFKRRPSEMEGVPVSPLVQNVPVSLEDANKPRSLRFTFNSNTTSSKPPDDIVIEVIKICNAKTITHRLQSRYLLECTFGQSQGGKEPVKFEVEVCKLPRLNNLHGLRFKRLSGASADYKEVCEILLSTIQL